ncbi:hypothetical protein [Rickettsiales endosymbiont of Stachyamoeba lipophora]|uniref:hypothetical protein n=1 Tax=Rickettsiales endosymbiont of Stachyamoeba lipophora TaxID=2486578 RepID=UPI000F648953|nr:hypothetical protein [Rickettsiales endosymbiont of Stachyamoeba lipophora]AZL15794.1 hypothetical protein EF513_04445 [Rickettsiales endosymbiont of Stachyamoeba lipophora]
MAIDQATQQKLYNIISSTNSTLTDFNQAATEVSITDIDFPFDDESLPPNIKGKTLYQIIKDYNKQDYLVSLVNGAVELDWIKQHKPELFFENIHLIFNTTIVNGLSYDVLSYYAPFFTVNHLDLLLSNKGADAFLWAAEKVPNLLEQWRVNQATEVSTLRQNCNNLSTQMHQLQQVQSRKRARAGGSSNQNTAQVEALRQELETIKRQLTQKDIEAGMYKEQFERATQQNQQLNQQLGEERAAKRMRLASSPLSAAASGQQSSSSASSISWEERLLREQSPQHNNRIIKQEEQDEEVVFIGSRQVNTQRR